MYEAFFHLQSRPFAAAPTTGAFYPAAAIEAARQTILRGIERASGPAVVLGGAGTGKSLLLSLMAQEFSGKFDIVQLATGRVRNVRALFQNFLFELNLPLRDLCEGELRLALFDRLEPRDKSKSGLLLLVDEAHALPGKLLDELRMITNLVRGGQPRVRLVLAGDTRLEERLANPRLASFQQRISARCYLTSLTREETLGYVRHQLSTAGAKPADVIDDAALSAIHRLTDGVPRLINQLCDHALILSAVAGQKRLDEARVEEAWADLQQLPVPQMSLPSGEEASSIIEFGALDDLPSKPERVTRFDGPTRSRDPLAQLDAIERHLNAAQQEGFSVAQQEGFAPLSVQASEIELEFSGPLHPFGGVFTEEEVVIDRYASLEAQTLRNRPRVSSSEGRAIATLMGAVAPARRQLGIVREETYVMPQHEMAAEAFEDPFDPASDPVMPEYVPGVSTNVAAANASPELVVVDTLGDAQRSPAPEAPGRAHRQEYRQLFARLRRGG
jgi:type II secretory pathway predicted ATPase ExeA